MKFLVTGGAGFIGSALVRYLVLQTDYQVVCLDKLTYAGNLASLAPVLDSERFQFVHADICDEVAVAGVLAAARPDKIVHLAAETHVDRSVDGPAPFIRTNLLGTYTLLEAALTYWRSYQPPDFCFLHVSTDEVFGTLGATGAFTEDSPYDPSSPYSASKAGSDHLVRAWHRTYGLPVKLTNCSNNYGPCQFPEKLIPLMILNCLEDKELPVYGEGKQVRDWLYVEDHVEAIYRVVMDGAPGMSYNIGGNTERTSLEVVQAICHLMDERAPGQVPRDTLIRFVEDRPGHDFRYAIDASRLQTTLGWAPRHDFDTALALTVDWYLNNPGWWRSVLDGSYQRERLGVAAKGKLV